MGQNQWCHFGVGAPIILVDFSGDWDVLWGYGILTHGHNTTFFVGCSVDPGSINLIRLVPKLRIYWMPRVINPCDSGHCAEAEGTRPLGDKSPISSYTTTDTRGWGLPK